MTMKSQIDKKVKQKFKKQNKPVVLVELLSIENKIARIRVTCRGIKGNIVLLEDRHLIVGDALSVVNLEVLDADKRGR